MAFKTRRTTKISVASPQALFRDLRNRSVEGLLDHQSSMLEAYMKVRNTESDIALELPTGSGKTLVGLLIAEYRRRVNEEKVVYLCPTKQLVNQVVQQSQEKYGIKTIAFTGSKKDFDPRAKALYTRGDILPITTYSGLFNTNPFFNDADIIIIDDAHAAENYIPSFWSVEINREEHFMLYQSIAELLRTIIPNYQYQRMKSQTPYYEELGWVEKIPITKFQEIIGDFISILDGFTQNDNLKFSWLNVREHLHACHLYVSWNKLLLRPIIPPSLTFAPFARAKQRIYMSATLGDSGDLERTLGMPKIHKLPIPEGWNRQGLGRRFFIFPEAIMDHETAKNTTVEMIKKVDRSLVLLPDEHSANSMRELIRGQTNHTLFNAKDIEQSKSAFVNTEQAVAVLANRFDGIDLIDEECRLLVLNSLPRATNLQESFLINRMAASKLFHDRIRTRLIQAIGRCTRSAVDYSAVCILGSSITDELVPKEKIRFLHPELQAEIIFGHDQSLNAEGPEELIENLEIFLKHGEEWDEADEDILNERDDRNQDKSETSEKLQESAVYEVDFLYRLWKRDFDNAMVSAGKVIQNLSGNDVKGYRGFWYYLSGGVAWMASKQGIESYIPKVAENFGRAAQCTDSITWFKEIGFDPKEGSHSLYDPRGISIVEGLESAIDNMGISSDRKFNNTASAILNKLQKDNLIHFEIGHEQLGAFLGYEAGNSEEPAAPDPWWIANHDLCIVSEDKFHEDPDKPLSVSEIRQAAGHQAWIQKWVNTLDENCEIVTVIITNANYIEPAARTFSEGLYYWPVNDFQEWAVHAVDAVRRLRTRFTEPGNLVFRSEALELLEQERIDPKNLLEKIKTRPLKDMPVGK